MSRKLILFSFIILSSFLFSPASSNCFMTGCEECNFDGTCNKCKLAFYLNKSQKNCLPCQEPCLTCTSAKVCVDCKDNMFRLGDTCVKECPDGYISNHYDCLSKNSGNTKDSYRVFGSFLAVILVVVFLSICCSKSSIQNSDKEEEANMIQEREAPLLKDDQSLTSKSFIMIEEDQVKL